MSKNTTRFLLFGLTVLVGLAAFGLTSIITLASEKSETEYIAVDTQYSTHSQTLDYSQELIPEQKENIKSTGIIGGLVRLDDINNAVTDWNALYSETEIVLPLAKLYSYSADNKIKAVELYDANYTANNDISGARPSSSETPGTDYNALAKGGEYAAGHSNDRNENTITGVKSKKIANSSFVLLACSFAVLGAALMFIRMRSKYLLN